MPIVYFPRAPVGSSYSGGSGGGSSGGSSSTTFSGVDGITVVQSGSVYRIGASQVLSSALPLDISETFLKTSNSYLNYLPAMDNNHWEGVRIQPRSISKAPAPHPTPTIFYDAFTSDGSDVAYYAFDQTNENENFVDLTITTDPVWVAITGTLMPVTAYRYSTWANCAPRNYIFQGLLADGSWHSLDTRFSTRDAENITVNQGQTPWFTVTSGSYYGYRMYITRSWDPNGEIQLLDLRVSSDDIEVPEVSTDLILDRMKFPVTPNNGYLLISDDNGGWIAAERGNPSVWAINFYAANIADSQALTIMNQDGQIFVEAELKVEGNLVFEDQPYFAYYWVSYWDLYNDNNEIRTSVDTPSIWMMDGNNNKSMTLSPSEVRLGEGNPYQVVLNEQYLQFADGTQLSTAAGLSILPGTLPSGVWNGDTLIWNDHTTLWVPTQERFMPDPGEGNDGVIPVWDGKNNWGFGPLPIPTDPIFNTLTVSRSSYQEMFLLNSSSVVNANNPPYDANYVLLDSHSGMMVYGDVYETSYYSDSLDFYRRDNNNEVYISVNDPYMWMSDNVGGSSISISPYEIRFGSGDYAHQIVINESYIQFADGSQQTTAATSATSLSADALAALNANTSLAANNAVASMEDLNGLQNNFDINTQQVMWNPDGLGYSVLEV